MICSLDLASLCDCSPWWLHWISRLILLYVFYICFHTLDTWIYIAGRLPLSTLITVGSRFATVRFTTIHFYDPCRVGPSTPDLWCNHCRNSSVLSLLSVLLALSQCAFVNSFFYFIAVLLSWLWFFPPMTPIKKIEIRKNQNSWRYILSDVFWTTAWAFFNKIKSDLTDIFFSIFCVIFHIPNSLN